MALLAQGFDPSGYTPSYAVANAANEQFFQNQQQGLQNISKGIEDYAKQQKDLAQKDKEMAAKIKGTMSLLDNAKGIYTGFAPQIDAMKVKLSDPSLSNLDKAGIASQVENTLGLFAKHGEDAMKSRLNEAQAQYYEARTTGDIGGGQPSVVMQDVSITNPDGSVTKYNLPFDKKIKKYVDPETSKPIGDINKWSNQEKGWEAINDSTTSNQNIGNQVEGALNLVGNYKSTAFGTQNIDKTTRNDIATGKMAAVKGDENIGSSGIRYRGLESDLPTVASKTLPSGAVINVVSDLFPQGKNFQVAGTGPASSNVIDFFASNKNDYNKLANQKIQNIKILNQQAQGISNAANMTTNQIGTPEQQNQIAQMISEGASKATAENVSPNVVGTDNMGEDTVIPTVGRAGGVTTIPRQVLKQRDDLSAINAQRANLKSLGDTIDPEFNKQIDDAVKSNDYGAISQYAEILKERSKKALEARVAAKDIENRATTEARIKAEAAKPAAEEAKKQAEVQQQTLFTNIDAAKSMAKAVESNILQVRPVKFVESFMNTKQKRLEDLIKPIENLIAIDTLNAMRKTSPTGASGLGQTTDTDVKLLKQQVRAIDPRGNAEDIVRDLNMIKSTVLDTVHGTKNYRIRALQSGKITQDQFDEIESMYPSKSTGIPTSQAIIQQNISPEIRRIANKYQ